MPQMAASDCLATRASLARFAKSDEAGGMVGVAWPRVGDLHPQTAFGVAMPFSRQRADMATSEARRSDGNGRVSEDTRRRFEVLG